MMISSTNFKPKPCLPMIKNNISHRIWVSVTKAGLCLGPEPLKFACRSHSTQAGISLKV